MKQSIKRIINRTADDISALFPYFFVFYIAIVFLSYFFASVRDFFYWPGVNIGILLLAIITFVSPRSRIFLGKVLLIFKGWDIKKPVYLTSKKVADKSNLIKVGVVSISKNLLIFIGKFLILFLSWAKNKISFLFHKLKALPLINKLKIVLIILVGILALVYKISVIDLLVLIYGLASIFFGLWPKSSAIFALILLISCPILLILKYDALAEILAIYAYYFLIIAVAVGIREGMLQEKVNDKKH